MSAWISKEQPKTRLEEIDEEMLLRNIVLSIFFIDIVCATSLMKSQCESVCRIGADCMAHCHREYDTCTNKAPVMFLIYKCLVCKMECTSCCKEKRQIPNKLKTKGKGAGKNSSNKNKLLSLHYFRGWYML